MRDEDLRRASIGPQRDAVLEEVCALELVIVVRVDERVGDIGGGGRLSAERTYPLDKPSHRLRRHRHGDWNADGRA